MFSFTKLSQKNRARRGVFVTEHGTVQTPVFMPVGTQSSVKALATDDLLAEHSQIVLGNTYHLYLRPGLDVMQQAGGLHSFMNWKKPILTDSGGFQVFSLGLMTEETKRGDALAKVTDEGVAFTSHIDGTKHFFTPEKAVEIQRILGSDIMMTFDECTPDNAPLAYAKEALRRTHRWAKTCADYWNSVDRMSVYGTYQSLFGIVQGAMHKDLRRESAELISSLGFDGVAVGGETVGYNMQGTLEVMDWIGDILPENLPRYAMGLGRDPEDIIHAVRSGFDMFDCVAPTRMARNGALYAGTLRGNTPSTWKFESEFEKGRLQIGNARWEKDTETIMQGCDCSTCAQGYSKAYLRHLFKSKELAYYRLASIHNIRFMIRLAEQLQKQLEE